MRRFYYFGCRGTSGGHYLHGSSYNKTRDTLDGGFPTHLLDGTFAPLLYAERGWKLTHLRFNGSVLSILACHDNTIDTRPGSNAAFVVVDSGPWDTYAILAEMKQRFPDCWERLRDVIVK